MIRKPRFVDTGLPREGRFNTAPADGFFSTAMVGEKIRKTTTSTMLCGAGLKDNYNGMGNLCNLWWYATHGTDDTCTFWVQLGAPHHPP